MLSFDGALQREGVGKNEDGAGGGGGGAGRDYSTVGCGEQDQTLMCHTGARAEPQN